MEKKNYIPSFLVAYLLSIGGLNRLMGIILNKGDGIMFMNLVPVAALLLLHFFVSDKKNDLNMDKKALLFVYYIISIIVVYKYAAYRTTFSMVNVLVYCIIPIYISFYKIDVEKVLKYMMLFSALIVPVSEEFFKDAGLRYETIGMSTTYNILPFIIAAIVHFMYYRKKTSLWTYIGYGTNLYYLIKVIYLGNRGPIISLIVCAILLIIRKINPDGTARKNMGRSLFLTIGIGVLAIVVVNNIENIIVFVYNWLKGMDIELAFVNKSIAKIQQGDLTNGRSQLFEFVINGIKEHYLIGNGIASIAYKSFGRFPYPHNLFLQMWYDLGIIVSFPLLCTVLRATKKTVYEHKLSKDTVALLILLFTLSIPRLCYSSEFWDNTTFWFLMMFSIAPNIYGKDSVEKQVIDEKTGETNE